MAERKRHLALNGQIYVIGMVLLLGVATFVGRGEHGPIWPLVVYFILSLPFSLLAFTMGIDNFTTAEVVISRIFLIAAPILNVMVLGFILRAVRSSRGEPREPVKRDGMELRTWDGERVAPEPPIGATVVVYRISRGEPEFLLLHRANRGPEDGDDWAWTPPSGARRPKESILKCARRELEEETGLQVRIRATDWGESDWAVFKAEVPVDAEVTLDAEHDRFEWTSLTEAARRCRPDSVASQIELVARTVH